jgi:hypothetical protein
MRWNEFAVAPPHSRRLHGEFRNENLEGLTTSKEVSTCHVCVLLLNIAIIVAVS